MPFHSISEPEVTKAQLETTKYTNNQILNIFMTKLLQAEITTVGPAAVNFTHTHTHTHTPVCDKWLTKFTADRYKAEYRDKNKHLKI
jgi:hypothetical protein